MTVWSFETVRSVADGRWLIGPVPGAAPPAGAAIDTRSITPGMIFFAFRGEHADGHAFLPDARARGAAMAVVTDASAVPPGVAMPVLLVSDATEALTRLAAHWRGAVPGLRVVGVTGSNGKTTTSRLVHAAACSPGGLPGTVSAKSFNNALGVPVTLLNARPDDRVLVCEIGASTPGEIARRCDVASPDAAVVTGVGEAHFGGLGSIEAIAAEKASIAAGVGEHGVVVVPSGIPVLDRALEATGSRARIVRVGAGPGADLTLADVRTEPGRVSFTLSGAPFAVPLDGAHNASNAALAVVVARWLGVDDATIRAGLAGVAPAPLRLERSVLPTDPPTIVINDAYNANPGSMRAALGVLGAEPASAGRRVAILGDMLELGDLGPRAHREVLEAAHDAGIDAIGTLGPLFAQAAADLGVSVHAEPGSDDGAVERVCALVRPGDTVLLKGSRGLRLERAAAVLAARAGRAGVGAEAR